MTLRGTALAALLSLACTSAVAQSTGTTPPAPKENKGLTAKVNQVVDLGPEIDGMQGRELRMRTLTIAPGGHIGLHSHKDRPSVAYFLKGTDTVTSGDGTKKVYRPGDTSATDKSTTHWHENKGKEPVELIIVDVFHAAH